MASLLLRLTPVEVEGAGVEAEVEGAGVEVVVGERVRQAEGTGVELVVLGVGETVVRVAVVGGRER